MAADDIRMNAENTPELSDEELDEIAGGKIHFNPVTHSYDAIDEKGNVIKSFPFVSTSKSEALRARASAKEYCIQMGLDGRYITGRKIEGLRANAQK